MDVSDLPRPARRDFSNLANEANFLNFSEVFMRNYSFKIRKCANEIKSIVFPRLVKLQHTLGAVLDTTDDTELRLVDKKGV